MNVNKLIMYFMLLIIISSCKKIELAWDLKRSSLKDAKVKVSELIYSNNCSSTSGFHFIATGGGTPSSIYWNISNIGKIGNCFKTEGNCLKASIDFDFCMTEDCILRFYFKSIQSTAKPIITINSTVLNTAIISGNEGARSEWIQIQTEIIKKGNNTCKIEFSSSAYGTYFIDEVEYWTPLF
jgi:hypothetical protein